MSTFFELRQSQPLITSSNVFGKTGEKVIISGEAFKKNITQVSGQGLYDNNLIFNVYGLDKSNVSGINNTIYEDAIEFTIPTGIQTTKYNLSVFNDYGQSTNAIQLHVVGQPNVTLLETNSAFPFEYVRVSGTNLYPSPLLKLIDEEGNVVIPSFQDSGLYRITGAIIESFGTGYAVGQTFNISGIKNYTTNTFATIQVTTTGESGSLASFNITNSGLFTIPNFSTGLSITSSSSNGRNALVNFLYEKNEISGDLQFIEFQVPNNVRNSLSGILENIRYKNLEGSIFQGFNVIGIPQIISMFPKTGIVDETLISLSGKNLTYVDNVYIDNLNVGFFRVDDTGIFFTTPNFGETNKVTVSGAYGFDTSTENLNILYPAILATGFSPNDILLGTGGEISINGKYLQRLNYINIGAQNILRNKITVSQTGTRASFALPENYKTTEIRAFSQDFPSSGTLIFSSSTNNKLIASVKLNTSNINLRYLSGVQAAKYLDEIEIYTPSGTSGDYGNLTNSEVLFLSITGLTNIPGSYSVTGIKTENTATGIKVRVPREIKNPRAAIKIKRNKFNDEYILPSDKSLDVLPTIYDLTPSNTLYNSLGFIVISGINASSVNQIYFSGYTGTKNVFGYKDISYFPLEIVNKNSIQITGSQNNTTGYTVIEAKLGGDIVGSGEIFLFNNYYDTGIGYENQIITKNRQIRVNNISGYRPPNSDIFTSPSIITSPLDQPFFYQIQTTSRATTFAFEPTTISGIGQADLPPGVNPNLNSSNQIFGTPSSGGNYYFKIRAIDGERPNEAMILQANFGTSGRSLAGAGIVYRGEWSPTVGYVGDSLRRDVVKYPNGANYWYAAVTNINSTPGPTNPNWIAFSNEFSATATQILIAEESNITSSLNIGRLGVPSGFIKTVNDIDSNLGSGFYLGYDNSYNPNLPKFRVGNSNNYVKFDGLGLDIVGPLSGILTTSKDITNANNIVRSSYSVALGINNTIETGSDNVFIFGTNNTATGSRRSSIVAGLNNTITGLNLFISEDSNIVGGQNNLIVGSYCNIGGGRGNVVDALSTGLAGIGNQIFSVPLTGQKAAVVRFPLTLYTNELALLHNIEKTGGDETFYDIKFDNITSTTYDVEFADILNTSDLDINLFTWVSVYSENLYSGSFQEGAKDAQFKIFKTGFNSGDQFVRINFHEPFVGQENLVVLNSLQGKDFYKTYVSGTDSTGFDMVFSRKLDEDIIGHFFVGNVGFFTGLNENSGKILEIGKVKPFENSIFGTGVLFDVNITRPGYIFENIYKPDRVENSIYNANIYSTGAQPLKIKLDRIIESSDQYIFLDGVSYTGDIFDYNIQVFRASLTPGSNQYFINLPSGMSGTYIPLVQEIATGSIYYNYLTSGHVSSGFYINFENTINEDVLLNVGIYRSGRYPFDSGFHYASSKIVSGDQTYIDVPFNIKLDNKPEILFDIENINRNNHYRLNVEDITKTGFSFKLSTGLASGEQIRVNYLAVEGTGYERYSNISKVLTYENYPIYKDITISTENSALDNVKVFGRAISEDNVFYHLFTHSDRSRFDIRISHPISGTGIKNFTYEYILTDLVRDLVLTRNLLGESAYGRLADFGFDDVGSSTIGGGTGNYIKGLVSVIGGGVKNQIFGDYNVIPGGRSNIISDYVSEIEAPKTTFCAVLAGNLNTITGSVQNAVIVGGEKNYIQNTNRSVTQESIGSTIIGGKSNVISGSYSAIVGGTDNSIYSSYSYCIGRNIDIYDSGSIVIADSTTGQKRNATRDSLTMHFASGVYITGVGPGASPLVFDINTLPTSAANVPIGGIYRSGPSLQIRLS